MVHCVHIHTYILLKDCTKTINNQVKLHILGKPVNKVGKLTNAFNECLSVVLLLMSTVTVVTHRFCS